MAKKIYPLFTSLTTDPKPNNLFSVQTRRLVKSFEGLNSSLAQLPGWLWSWYDTLETGDFTRNWQWRC